ncbi:MAG TPA: ankyrin repeat domain-containing protein [Cyclobacteriaceae bacterium]|nr:ankyrin repeat domain-containing protein [Cyclobacteriaceae bacterium]
MAHGDWKDLIQGIQDNNIALVKYYISIGVDINFQHPEIMSSPLIESIRCGYMEITALLLAHGARPELKEAFSNKSPMQIAEEMGNEEALLLLKQLTKAKDL